MNENNTRRLTETAAAEMYGTDEEGHTLYAWRNPERAWVVRAMGAAFDAGQKYQDDLEDSTIRDVMQDVHHLRVERDDAIARAERAEDLLADAVHVDEAARRVEAARGQGWDDAADWVKQREVWTDEELRAANPHRPAPALPTEDGAVIVPAEGFEFIWVEGGRYFDRLTYSSRTRRWYGVAINGGPAWASFWYGDPETITTGTWRTV